MSETAKPSRRLFLAAGPAAAVFGALALSAGIPSVDPIFAAIERHKMALDAFCATLNPVDEIWAEQHGREITRADEDAYEAARAVEEGALDGLFSTPPTTLPGMRAVLEHVMRSDECCDGRIAETLLKSPLLAGMSAEEFDHA
jgi:hypothetical protein